MYKVTFAIASIFASLASAAPLEARQECYPWFIAALPESCSVYNPTAQLSSGPSQSPPPSWECQPISPGASFPAASVNPNACADNTYTVTLYTTTDCSDEGQKFTSAQCLSAPAGSPWVYYSATPNTA